MTRPAYRVFLCIGCVLALAGSSQAFPKPGPTPRSWQFAFDHGVPKRVLITPKGSDRPQAYWYMTYTVSNPGLKQQDFYPSFDLATGDGLVIRSDGKRYETVNGEVREVKRTVTIDGKKHEITDMIPQAVIEAIRLREKNPSLKSVNQIAGPLRVGAGRGAGWRGHLAGANAAHGRIFDLRDGAERGNGELQAGGRGIRGAEEGRGSGQG